MADKNKTRKRGARKGKAREAKARTDKARKDRIGDLVKLQKNAVERWGTYSVNAAKLVASGQMNPGNWMEQYKVLADGVAEDVGALMKILFPKETQ